MSLGFLGQQVSDAAVQQLVSLLDSLPGRSETERRREVSLALQALRQRLLRLLALSRWASTAAEPLQQLSRAYEAAAQREASFHDAAGRLALAHSTSGGEPLHDVPAALAVLCGATLHLLPAVLEDLLPHPPSAKLLEPGGCERLDSALRLRLLHATLPQSLRVTRVADGVATLQSEHEYEADVTLAPSRTDEASAEPQGGWALLCVRVLAGEGGAAFFLAAPAHRRLVWEANQRCAASHSPLQDLHLLLRELVATLARDALVRQARVLCAGRWANCAVLAPLPGNPPPPGFQLHFWPRVRLADGEARALRVSLGDATRRLCCSLALPDSVSAFEPRAPLLQLNNLDLEAMLRGALQVACLQRLQEAAAALAAHPTLRALPARLLDDAQSAPRLLLSMPGMGEALASLRCELRTGALRIAAEPGCLIEDTARHREAHEQSANLPTADSAVLLATAAWCHGARRLVAQQGQMGEITSLKVEKEF